jgi:hypothetical protein
MENTSQLAFMQFITSFIYNLGKEKLDNGNIPFEDFRFTYLEHTFCLTAGFYHQGYDANIQMNTVFNDINFKQGIYNLFKVLLTHNNIIKKSNKEDFTIYINLILKIFFEQVIKFKIDFTDYKFYLEKIDYEELRFIIQGITKTQFNILLNIWNNKQPNK